MTLDTPAALDTGLEQTLELRWARYAPRLTRNLQVLYGDGYILIVLPMYGGSLPIGRYCGNALRGLEHLVEYFKAPTFYKKSSCALKSN